MNSKTARSCYGHLSSTNVTTRNTNRGVNIFLNCLRPQTVQALSLFCLFRLLETCCLLKNALLRLYITFSRSFWHFFETIFGSTTGWTRIAVWKVCPCFWPFSEDISTIRTYVVTRTAIILGLTKKMKLSGRWDCNCSQI